MRKLLRRLREAPPPPARSRPQMVLATGLLAAVLDPQRTLARQRWTWDADRDLRR